MQPLSPKLVGCMPMKFSHVDGMVKLNIRYTFVVMATNCDVIGRQKIGFEAVQKRFFSGLFLAVLLTYISYYINIQYFLIFIVSIVMKMLCRNSVLVGVQEYSVTIFLPNIFSAHTDNVFLGKVVKY